MQILKTQPQKGKPTNQRVSIGFIGSTKGMTHLQYSRLVGLLTGLKDSSYSILYYGNCYGSDEQAFSIAHTLGYYTVSIPSNLETQRANTTPSKTLKPESPIRRDRSIISRSDLLIVVPKAEKSILHSRSWSAIRWAKKLYKPTIVILPDGLTESKSL